HPAPRLEGPAADANVDMAGLLQSRFGGGALGHWRGSLGGGVSGPSLIKPIVIGQFAGISDKALGLNSVGRSSYHCQKGRKRCERLLRRLWRWALVPHWPPRSKMRIVRRWRGETLTGIASLASMGKMATKPCRDRTSRLLSPTSVVPRGRISG